MSGVEGVLTAQAWWLLILFSWRQQFAPIERWKQFLGEPGAVPPKTHLLIFNPLEDPGSVDSLVTKAIRRATSLLPYTPTCLAQAATGMRLLYRQDRAAEIIIGLQQSDDSMDSWPAHAWLTTDAGILTGGREVGNFHPTSLFRLVPRNKNSGT
jgi:hypothetical protein